MVLGKDVRLNRILNKGKMLCVPMDHGISTGPLDGIKNISKFIYDTEGSGLTCFLVNKGIIKDPAKTSKDWVNSTYVREYFTWP